MGGSATRSGTEARIFLQDLLRARFPVRRPRFRAFARNTGAAAERSHELPASDEPATATSASPSGSTPQRGHEVAVRSVLVWQEAKGRASFAGERDRRSGLERRGLETGSVERAREDVFRLLA